MTNPLPQLKIKAAIQSALLDNFNKNITVKSEQIIQVIQKAIETEYIYGDTILRYLRELREDGKLSYECKCKKSRVFEFKKV